MTKREMNFYSDMVELGIATGAELDLVKTLMAGSWEEILNAVLCARTGLRSYEQLMNEMSEDEDDEGDDILICMRESVEENWY